MASQEKSDYIKNVSNLLVVMEKGGIERQERNGQADMVRRAETNAASLPRKMGNNGRTVLESFGVVFGDNVDDLFVSVTLPAGWKIQATDHALHSKLLDDKERTRAAIFYKAAFYDRDADLTLTNRYSLRMHLPLDAAGSLVERHSEQHTHNGIAIYDCDKVVENVESVPLKTDGTKKLTNEYYTKCHSRYL